jgi:predicted dehydrogenase
MSEPIRVGIIGANPSRGWALGTHLPALVALDGFELVAVATRHEDSARAAAEAFGVPHAFGDAAALIAHPDVDLVTVSVKVPDHHDLVAAAIEAGKHVFCEWPLGANTHEAKDLLDRATAKGVRHVIGLQGRESPKVNRLRDLVQQGFIGALLHASLSVEYPGAVDELGPDREWSVDKANGVGPLRILGGHNLDILRFVIGDLTELQSIVALRHDEATVLATGLRIPKSIPDVVLVQGRADAGAFVTISIQAGLPRGTGGRLVLQGTEGFLELAGPGSLHFGDAGLRLTGAQGDAEPQELVVPPAYDPVSGVVEEAAARNVAGLYLKLSDAASRGDDPAALQPSFSTALDLHRLIDEIDAAAVAGDRRTLRA